MSVLGACVLAAIAAALAVRPRVEGRLAAWGVRPVPRRADMKRAVVEVFSRVGIGPGSRRRRARQRATVLRALGALAAELEAGLPPTEALLRAGGPHRPWPHAERAATWGGDVCEALRLDAREAPVLSQVAACWQVGARGSGLATSLRQVATTARAAEDTRVEMEGQLAGPRATARMLAVLPLVGVGLGVMLGADPISWLLTTMPGQLCLGVGVLLTVLGTWWTGRIAAAVERLL